MDPRARAYIFNVLGRLLRKTYDGYDKHRLGDLAGMLTYYTIFALFPFAILTVTLTLLVLPPDVLREAFKLVAIAVPGPVAPMLIEQMQRMVQEAGGGFAVGAAALAVWGASRGAVALQTALNQIHEVKETRPWWKVQVVSIGITVGVSLLLLIAMVLMLFGPSVGHLIADRLRLGTAFDVAWTIGRYLGAALLVMLVWACLYYFLPNIKRRFRWVTPGAMAGVALWLLASRGFMFYVDSFASYDKTYGTLGTVIVFLTWLWLSSLSLLLGGQIDDAIDDVRKKTEPAGEVPVTVREGRGAFPVTPDVGRVEPAVVAKEKRPDRRLLPGRVSLPARPPALGLAELVKRVGDDFAELARIELRGGMKRAIVQLAAGAGGGLVALGGLAFLCVSAVAAAEPLIAALWLRILLGALLYVALGGGLVYAAVIGLRGGKLPWVRSSKPQPTSSERSTASVKSLPAT